MFPRFFFSSSKIMRIQKQLRDCLLRSPLPPPLPPVTQVTAVTASSRYSCFLCKTECGYMHDHSVCPSTPAQPRVHDRADLYMTADLCDATYISGGSNFSAVTIYSAVTRLAGSINIFSLNGVFLSNLRF